MKFLYSVSTNTHVERRSSLNLWWVLNIQNTRICLYEKLILYVRQHMSVLFSGNNIAKTNVVAEEGHRFKWTSHQSYLPTMPAEQHVTVSYTQRHQLSSARISGYSSQNWSPIMSQCRGTTLVLVRVTSTSFSSASFGSFIFLVMTSLIWRYSWHINRHMRLQRGFTNGQETKLQQKQLSTL